MRIPSSRDRRLAQDSTLTPMIDVVFLLLIFFVCASVGQIQELLLPADLPAGSIETATAPEPQERPFGEVWLFLNASPAGTTVVQVNRGGTRYTDLERVREQLLQLTCFLRGDSEVFNKAVDEILTHRRPSTTLLPCWVLVYSLRERLWRKTAIGLVISLAQEGLGLGDGLSELAVLACAQLGGDGLGLL